MGCSSGKAAKPDAPSAPSAPSKVASEEAASSPEVKEESKGPIEKKVEDAAGVFSGAANLEAATSSVQELKDESAALLDSIQGVLGTKEKQGTNKRDKSASDRAQAFVESLKGAPGEVADPADDSPVKQALRFVARYLVKPLIVVFMIYAFIGKQLYKVYKILPSNVIQMVFGATLCFFGGTFFAALAAAEAANNFGGKEMYDHLWVVWEEGGRVAEATVKDDEVDANNDGIVDVDQMSTNQLINHKAFVAMVAVKEPQRLEEALQKLMAVWITVIGTLKVKFMQTLAIALGIGDMITLPANRVFGPPLGMLLGPDLQHWSAPTIDTSIKLGMCFIASYLQAIISAFYSGLRGGQMFADGLFKLCDERGCWAKLPDCLVAKPYDPDTTYIDDAIKYPLAAAGFYWQITNGFSLPFPFDLLLLPLTLIEWFLRISIFC